MDWTKTCGQPKKKKKNWLVTALSRASLTLVTAACLLQINCLEEQCGLSPFAGSKPDQWYRFILAIFLHSGVIHVIFVLVFQHGVLADVERMAGWWRLGNI